MKSAGFTLIELLVVISIIAVLAAMLLPAIQLVKGQAKQLRCAASQRQVGAAVIAYTTDWDGLLPRLKTASVADPTQPAHWFNVVAEYVGHDSEDSAVIASERGSSVLWGCPAWKPVGVFATIYRPGVGMTWFPMAPGNTRSSLFSDGHTWNMDFTLSQITQRPRRIMLGDAMDWHLSVSLPSTGYNSPPWDPGRHIGRSAVYTFFDGHVQSVAAHANAYLGCSDPTSASWNP